MSSGTPTTLETADCEKLLDALLSNDSTFNKKRKAVRNHCMALLMLDAGLRVGELVALQVSDLFFAGNPVTTLVLRSQITKNHRERTVPVSERLSKSLAEYLVENPWLKNRFDTYPAWGSPLKDTPPTTRHVERIICAAGLKALGRPVHPHVLRHTFASRLMRVTNVKVVQELLGHKYLSSTQIYMHPNEDDKKSAIDSLHSELTGLGEDLEGLAGFVG